MQMGRVIRFLALLDLLLRVFCRTMSSSHVRSWTPQVITAIPGLSMLPMSLPSMLPVTGQARGQERAGRGTRKDIPLEYEGLSLFPQGECDISLMEARKDKGCWCGCKGAATLRNVCQAAWSLRRRRGNCPGDSHGAHRAKDSRHHPTTFGCFPWEVGQR